MENVTIKEASKQLNMTQLFLREWIASGTCPFGVCVTFNGSSKRTFNINAERLEKWKQGEL